MTCTCFSDRLAQLEERIRLQAGDVADFSVKWADYTYFISGGDYAPVNPKLEISFRKAKNGGGYCAKATKQSVTVTANYCPFCGRKLGGSAVSKAA